MAGDNAGLSIFVSDIGLEAVGTYSGDSAGEVVDSTTAEGTRGINASGEAVGEYIVEGDAAGEIAEVALSRVSTSSFIPWLQCPNVPQMKYILPAEVRGMVVVPSL